MRELESHELEQVGGGGLPFVVASAAITGFASYANGNSIQTALGAAVLGGAGGVARNLATAASGLMRVKWNTQALSLAFASGTITGSGDGESDIGDQEKVLEK